MLRADVRHAPVPRWRRAAGIWGPAAFTAAAVVGAARQPGYDHRHRHVSGLAAKGTRSAPIMIAGFTALGVSSMVMPERRPLRSLVRAAGVGTLAAGFFRCSDVRCPDPTQDPDATASDAAHGAASIATFCLWTSLPFADAHSSSGVARSALLGLGALTVAGFVGAGATTMSDHDAKGTAQRAFLASVFTWYASSALRALTGDGSLSG